MRNFNIGIIKTLCDLVYIISVFVSLIPCFQRLVYDKKMQGTKQLQQFRVLQAIENKFINMIDKTKY